MKKGVIFGTLAGIMLLSLTSCGNSGTKLTCTQSDEQEQGTLREDMVVTFKEDHIDTLDITFQIDVNDEYAEYVDELEDSMKDLIEQYEKYATDYDVRTSGNTIRGILRVEYNKLSEEAREEADLNDVTYDSMKEEMEDSGFTCR